MTDISERKDILINFPAPPAKCVFTTASRNGHLINIKEGSKIKSMEKVSNKYINKLIIVYILFMY